MKIRSGWLLLAALLAVGCAAPRVVIPVTFDCQALRLTAVTNRDQPVDFPAHGFSVLPPPGEHWCFGDSGAWGTSFRTHPLFGSRFEAPPPRTAVAHTFYVMVVAEEVRDAKVDTSEELRAFAQRWVSRSGGRFRVVEAQVVPDTSLGVECVRTDHVVEERDNPRMPGVVLVQVNRPYFICRHPYAMPSKLVAIFGSERYVQGQPAGPLVRDTRKEEVEAFIRSLRFMRPR